MNVKKIWPHEFLKGYRKSLEVPGSLEQKAEWFLKWLAERRHIVPSIGQYACPDCLEGKTHVCFQRLNQTNAIEEKFRL